MSTSDTARHQRVDREYIVRCDSVTREYTRGRSGTRFFSRRRSTGPRVQALVDVSLSVSPGEIVGIKGPSGSGKSTLLHLLAALDTPTSGTVTLLGTETSQLPERRRAALRLSYVGIVFQQFYLLPSLSARANVALPLIEAGVSKQARRRRATQLLEQVGLEKRIDHLPGELSGGEQQRVAIARALANDPALLLADEPTGEVDSQTGKRLIDLFGDVAEECGIVVASHDEEMLQAADRLYRLRDGRIVDTPDHG